MGVKSGFVSIIGRPNVGKSTFLNTVIGQKIAIVSDKPQTTRNRIQGIYTSESGQIIFIDTPGIHRPRNRLGKYMVGVARATVRDADVILYMVDAADTLWSGQEFISETFSKSSIPIFLVVNKIDSDHEQAEACVQHYRSQASLPRLCLSAALGTNVNVLLIRF